MSEIDHGRALSMARGHAAAKEATACHHGLHTFDELTLARAYLDLVDRVLPSLRREHVALEHHEPRCQLLLGRVKQTAAECDCGADEHNSKIDAIIGAQK